MSYRALELKDGRVALLHPDTPVVYATIEEPANPAFSINPATPRVFHVARGKKSRKKRVVRSAPPRNGGAEREVKRSRSSPAPDLLARAKELHAEGKSIVDVHRQLVAEGSRDLKYSRVWNWLSK